MRPLIALRDGNARRDLAAARRPGAVDSAVFTTVMDSASPKLGNESTDHIMHKSRRKCRYAEDRDNYMYFSKNQCVFIRNISYLSLLVPSHVLHQ